MATELATAYVQIIPSAEGITGKITEALGGEASEAGKSAGAGIAGAIKGAIAAAGIGEAIKSALNEGAALQQSIGGVETLFKDSAGTIKQYADEAYKSAGLSANQYMETVTGFSASLLQSLDGDTNAAAEAANQAIIAMSDNANKMGTDMQSIQNAYQGFAKQNYTMLDNLKLGYGGTKQEMERLLQDATALSGIEYDIDNLSDVYSAIQVIQDSLDITGTTAKEASETFSGSFAAMRSAAQNVLGNLTLGEDIAPSLMALGESVDTFVRGNLLPMLGNLFQGVFSESVLSAVPSMLEGAIAIVGELAQGIADTLPELLPTIVSMVISIAETLIDNVDMLIDSAIAIILALADGLIQCVPILIEKAPEIVLKLVEAVIRNAPKLLDAAVELIFKLAEGIVNSFGTLFEKGAEIVEAVKDGFADKVEEAKNWGRDLIDNFVSGIKEKWESLKTSVSNVAQTVKDYLGFSEPSKGPLSDFHTYAPDMIDLFVSGIRQGIGTVENAMDSLASAAVPDMSVKPFETDVFDAMRTASRSTNYAPAAQGEPATGDGSILGAIYQLIEVVQNKDFDVQLDGRSMAQSLYSYHMEEDCRRGPSLVEVSGVSI